MYICLYAVVMRVFVMVSVNAHPLFTILVNRLADSGAGSKDVSRLEQLESPGFLGLD